MQVLLRILCSAASNNMEPQFMFQLGFFKSRTSIIILFNKVKSVHKIASFGMNIIWGKTKLAIYPQNHNKLVSNNLYSSPSVCSFKEEYDLQAMLITGWFLKVLQCNIFCLWLFARFTVNEISFKGCLKYIMDFVFCILEGIFPT